MTGYTHEDCLAMQIADDQTRQERLLTEDGLELDFVLISECGVYQAKVLFNVSDYGELQRWISGTVVPQVRSQFNAAGQRHVQLQFERQCLRVLGWQDDLWVRFGDLPRVLGGRSPIAGRSGWRGWAKRLRT